MGIPPEKWWNIFFSKISMFVYQIFDVFPPVFGRYQSIYLMLEKNMFHRFSGGIPDSFLTQITYNFRQNQKITFTKNDHEAPRISPYYTGHNYLLVRRKNATFKGWGAPFFAPKWGIFFFK